MTTPQRLKYAKKARLCIYCLDAKYVYKGPGSRHVNCIAFKKNCFFTCQDSSCKVHVLLCETHKSQNKEKLDQTKKFWENQGKHFAHIASSPEQSFNNSAPLVSLNDALIKSPDSVITIGESPISSELKQTKIINVEESETPAPILSSKAVSSQDPALYKENIQPSPVNSSMETRLFEAAEKLREDAGPDVIVHPLPPGEPLFMFSSTVGKTRPLNVFYDSGASHLMIKEAAVKELDAVMIQKGPLTINAAGDTVVTVNDEYLVTMEKTDGSKQIMIGVSANMLTSDFPLISTKEAHKDIIKNTPKVKSHSIKSS